MRKFKLAFMLKLLAFSMGVLFPICIFAQQLTLRGDVTDVNGEPIIGASIMIKGTTKGVVTDFDGHFVLRTPGNATIVVSYLSYLSQEIPVAGKNSIKVVLKEDAVQLDEVMVVGYGTVKRKDLTGSVSAVSGEDLKDAPVSNIGQALQGKISGLQIIDSGAPGSGVDLKIRGLGSINNCDPLVVFDGVPTDLNIVAFNMEDIERIDVLKDASATAIYGSRGANGVIMITTKKGRAGNGVVSVTADYNVQKAARVPEMLNAAQYAALNNDMMVNSGRPANPAWADPATLGVGTNWLDELLRTGMTQKYSLNYSGGGKKYSYYVSGGFLDQTGTVTSVRYQRYNFQLNSEAQVLDWLKFSNSITFSGDSNKSGSYSIGNAMLALPVYPVKDEYGEWSGPEGNQEWYGSVSNPIGPSRINKNQSLGFNLLSNISGEITFTKWLKFKTTFGYDSKFWFADNFTPKYAWKPFPQETTNRTQSSTRIISYLSDNYFLFDHTFAKKHHLSMMAGTSAQWGYYAGLAASKNGFMFDSVRELDNGMELAGIGGNRNEWSLLSQMGRLNYSFDDRYFLTATVRHDGSSRFGPDYRWGTFPSLSLGWRPTAESWFPKNKLMNDIKVRAGYGITGSQASVGTNGYLAYYDTGVYSFGTTGEEQAAVVAKSLANPGLHWEEVAQTNIGVDLSLFNSRLDLSVDAYLKNTNDMIVKASIPITSGFEDTSTTFKNAGKVRNSGIEMSLHSINFNGNFGWETDVNVTYNQNKIINLNSNVPYYINLVNNSFLTILKEGYPINAFYGFVTDGIFQTQEEVDNHAFQPGAAPGDIRFKDLDNDGIVNDNDRTFLGNPNPNLLFSMNNRFTWKGFELSVFLQGLSGNKIYNANNISNTGMATAFNQTTDVLHRWTGEGTSDKMPRGVYGDPNQNCRASNRFIEDGSYLRLKNILFSYSLPSSIIQKMHLKGMRFSFSCENVDTITKYTGFDPEISISGIDSSRYPIPRTFNVAFNVKF